MKKRTEQSKSSGKLRVGMLLSILLMALSMTGCSMYLDGDYVETDTFEDEELVQWLEDEYVETEGGSSEEAPDGTTETDGNNQVETGSEEVAFETSEAIEVQTSESEDAEVTVAEITFRNDKLLDQHYEKHGIEMGFASAQEYELAAYKVIINSETLHKIEAEDGDDVYYLEETNEFVVVSRDGYIRTYFNPSAGIDYYNRQ